MRVLFWSETFWPRIGGVENLAARLLPALQQRGHQFAVVTWENIEGPDEIFYKGIPVYRFPFFSSMQQRGLNLIMKHRGQVAALKNRFRPDLIHINSYGHSVLFHLSTVIAHQAPALVTLHQTLPGERVERDSLLGHLLRSAAWLNTCSEAVLAHARQVIPGIIPCSSVIHNALEVPSCKPQPLPFEAPRLFCVGRLVAEKGFDSALTAFASVLHCFPKARLVLVGDGPARHDLTNRISKLGLATAVEFTGTVAPETVPELMNQATIVVIPSRLEGFGLVALEAALMERPVVAMSVGGLPEVVRHQHTGLLVEPENTAALADAVIYLLRNPAAATQMGQAARLRAQQAFNWYAHVDAYDNLYEKLVTDSSSTSRC